MDDKGESLKLFDELRLNSTITSNRHHYSTMNNMTSDAETHEISEWEPTPKVQWCNTPTRNAFTGHKAPHFESAIRQHLDSYLDYLEKRFDDDDAWKAYTNSRLLVDTSQAGKDQAILMTIKSTCPRVDSRNIGTAPWQSNWTFPLTEEGTSYVPFKCVNFDRVSPPIAQPNAQLSQPGSVEVQSTLDQLKRETIDSLPDVPSSHRKARRALLNHHNRLFDFAQRSGSRLSAVQTSSDDVAEQGI